MLTKRGLICYKYFDNDLLISGLWADDINIDYYSYPFDGSQPELCCGKSR